MRRTPGVVVNFVTVSGTRTRGGRIAAAVSSGAIARVLSSVVALVSLPLAVRYLGAERFGVWATITSTVVFLNLLDLGVASTLTNHIARAFALEDKEYAARYVTNALALTSATAGVSGLGLIVAWTQIDWMALFGVANRVLRDEVNATMAIAASLMLIGLPVSLASRIFAGYQEVHLNNMFAACGTIANLCGLLLGVALRISMPWLFLMSVGCTTLCNVAALTAQLWIKPWLRPRRAYLSWPAARELLTSGSGFLLVQIAGAVVFSSDNVVVSHYLGAAQVTPYNIAWRLGGLTAVVQALIFPALWPACAEAYARGDLAWMRQAFRLMIRSTLALNLAFGVVFIAFGKTAIRWWAGEAAAPPIALLAAMGLWSVISGCMTAESCLLAAVNRTRAQGVLSIIAAVLNLALSIALVQRTGSVGVILGTILSYLLVLVVPQSLIVRKVLFKTGSETLETALQPVTASQLSIIASH